MINKISRDWNFTRIVRLALGIFIIAQGIVTKEWIFALLGGLLAIMPLLNIGCCSASGCGVSVYKKHKKSEDITYEETH